MDNTGGCQIYLSKDSLGASITTAKSSEINVLAPGAEPGGDLVCFQLYHCVCCFSFLSLWVGGGLNAQILLSLASSNHNQIPFVLIFGDFCFLISL